MTTKNDVIKAARAVAEDHRPYHDLDAAPLELCELLSILDAFDAERAERKAKQKPRLEPEKLMWAYFGAWGGKRVEMGSMEKGWVAVRDYVEGQVGPDKPEDWPTPEEVRALREDTATAERSR